MSPRHAKTFPAKAAAIVFTAVVLAVGFALLGWIPLFLFAFGYVGGLVLWMLAKDGASFRTLQVPYFMALTLFAAHKLEERQFDFFQALSQITGVPTPEAGTFLGILLYLMAGAWLLIPFLVQRRFAFGYYLAWTFFASMGVTELAHFVFPFFVPGPLTYFPGMATVVLLAPVGWWGMHRLYALSAAE